MMLAAFSSESAVGGLPSCAKPARTMRLMMGAFVQRNQPVLPDHNMALQTIHEIAVRAKLIVDLSLLNRPMMTATM
jgi:hypothetical protein